MVISGAERQRRHRDKKRKALAVATRPSLQSESVLLLEGIVDGAIGIAWSIGKRQGNCGGYADERAFRLNHLGQLNLAEVLETFLPEALPEEHHDLAMAIECIRNVHRTSKACLSFGIW